MSGLWDREFPGEDQVNEWLLIIAIEFCDYCYSEGTGGTMLNTLPSWPDRELSVN